MIAPIDIRARVDLLLEALAEALRSVELWSVATIVEIAIEPARLEATRAALLHDQTDRIPVTGRQIYLRMTCVWCARTCDALAVDEAEEAERWLEKAGYELERFYEPVAPPQIGCAVSEAKLRECAAEGET